jgi:uncharacterized protein YqgC (DUF456 family)
MYMVLTVLYWLLLMVMAVGVVGAFVPALPGIGLILVAMLVWGLATGFSQVTTALIVAGVVLVLSLGIDYLATYIGTQRVGASLWGQIGAMVGLVLGALGLLPALPIGGPLLGMLLGSILGAFVGEFVYRRDLALGARLKLGWNVSLAIVVSSFIGNVIAGILALATLVVFVVTTWPPVL